MSQTNIPQDLTPKLVRAARALLAWSQQDLAKAANVGTSTIADFERSKRTPVANNAQSIRRALENAGISFLPNGAVIGPPLPGIASAKSPGMPIRWVTAQDLSEWADRTDGAFSLPTLISHLINATHGSAIKLRFPSDEGVRHPGWDGVTRTDASSTYVPEGIAGWEIGSQRSKIASKANEDFHKRSQNPETISTANATFVFVTPRHWPQKDEWALTKKDEGLWRDVRVYDGDDLVHWIEQAPAVGLWLAKRLGKRPGGIRELDELWEEWSLATKWPLTEDLVLSDRDKEAAEVQRWLRGEPSVLSLQSTTSDEVAAFFHATLSMFPEEIQKKYRARCLVATTATSARQLLNAPAPLILLMTEPEPGLARALEAHGHFVLLAYDERIVARGDVRELARPSREGIAAALIMAGIAEPQAKRLARDSARNLAVLRRQITSAPGGVPRWGEEAPPRALAAALLAGGWDEELEADRERLSEIAGQSYEDIMSTLGAPPYLGDFDSPMKKVGSTWRVASPADAWSLLARYLTQVDIARFEAAAQAVLGSTDPRFGMPSDERWMVADQGKYSNVMRLHIPAHREHPFRTNVNTYSGLT